MFSRKTWIVFLLLLGSLWHLSQATMLDRPKVGLVLSGGGAKGFAHLGVLKMLDSLEIPVDYIAGTSMGGIIGALYATGYRGDELEELVLRTDWQEIFTDQPPRSLLPYIQKIQTGRYQLEFGFEGLKLKPPSGLIFGQKISLLFSSLTFPYERVRHFDELPIPFRCIAVDLITGNQVVLEDGSLSKAMRATMAIPTAFSPVDWGDSLLIDGGILNNLPVDVVKEMGADVVIAVDVSAVDLETTDFDNILEVLDRSINLFGIERWRKNRDVADIYIQPDLTGYSLVHFMDNKIKGIIRQGDLAAKANEPKLVALKKRFELERVFNPYQLTGLSDSVRVHGVQITGQTSLLFSDIYQMLGCKPNALFEPEKIERKLAEIRASGYVEKITYETIPISDDYVRLVFHVEEREKPQIQGIRIHGNTTLPFGFIYRLLGLKPGDYLDTSVLNQRIMELYALGYFENIRYDLEPVPLKRRVRLNLYVKEKPLRRWRLGLRYDNHHRIVATVMSQATNLPLPGMRLETEMQFLGLQRVMHRGYYPSRSLSLPVYPFYALAYKNIPTNIYGTHGVRIAEYKDQSFSATLGMGLLLKKTFSFELGYTYENVHTEPEIALPDPTRFPYYRDELNRLDIQLRLDDVDDAYVPRKGVLLQGDYEGSYKKLGTEQPYQWMSLFGESYNTYGKRHTLRVAGFYTTSTGEIPIYKYANQGNPDQFIGMGYDQLTGNRFSYIRMDYRYELASYLFLKVMGNRTLSYEYRTETEVYHKDNLWGAGLALMIATPLGPLDLMVSRGSQCTVFSGSETRYYVTFGAKF